MSNRDLFIALLLASTSSGSSDPVRDAQAIFKQYFEQDQKGNIPS